MKKLLSAFLAVLLAVSAACTAWAASLSDVGVVGERIPDRFLGKEDLLTQRFKKAFQWATQLHAHDSQALFDFGQTSGQYMHAWSGAEYNENAYEIVVQDFDGGNSTALGHWAGLLCANADTCEVIVLRDAPATYYIRGGGVNNLEFGDPITNQYWRMEYGIPVLYQQFQNGYFRAEEGDINRGVFHSFIAEGYAYVKPPAAPPAYGSIYEANADGCTWENPLYIPDADLITSQPTQQDPILQRPSSSTPSQSDTVSSRIIDPGPEAFVTSSASSPPAANTTSEFVTSDSTSASPTESQLASVSSVPSYTSVSSDYSTGATAVSDPIGKGRTALLAGLVVVCLLVTGGGVFCLYWFVLRGKKKSGGPPQPPDPPPGQAG